MNPKKLDPESIYAKYDINHDGTVSDEEMKRNQELIELELREEKSEAQKNMAWIAMVAMLVFTALVFLPIFPDSRINALSDLFSLFYIGMAGVVSAYFGAAAFMSRNAKK